MLSSLFGERFIIFLDSGYGGSFFHNFAIELFYFKAKKLESELEMGREQQVSLEKEIKESTERHDMMIKEMRSLQEQSRMKEQETSAMQEEVWCFIYIEPLQFKGDILLQLPTCAILNICYAIAKASNLFAVMYLQ